MPYYPNPAGGSMYVANQAEAESKGWTPSMGTFGTYSQYEQGAPPSSGSGGGGAAPVGAQAGGQQLAGGINSLLGAIASGNKQAFDEAVRQFNATFGLDQSKFNEAIRQFNESLGVTQAGLTGAYQGSQTQQAQNQAYSQALAAAGLTGQFAAPAQMPTAADFGKQGATEQQGWIARYGNDAANQWANSATQRVLDFAAQNPQATTWTLGGATGTIRPATTETLASQLQRAQQLGTYQGQQTLAAQLQAFNEQQALAQMYGQGYANFGQVAPGQETLAAQKQAADIAAQRALTSQNWAQLYGYTPSVDANGNPVLVNGSNGQAASTLAAQQQAYSQGLGAIQAAAALQANPFRQQQVIGQLGRLMGGQGVAGFSSPNTVAGVGTQGGNTSGGLGYMQQMIDDIRGGTGNQNSASMNSVLDAIPTPTKMNSTEFFRSPQSTQNLVLQGMSEKYGLDPADSLQQLKNTLPQFASPTTFGGVRR